MREVIEFLRLWTAELMAMAGPTVVFGVIGAILGGLLALVIALAVGRILQWGRRRSVRVSSLAARGATRAEIARRTGISQDAVGMLLHVRGAHRGRRNLPVPARIAASQRADARRRNRDWNPQVFAGTADTGMSPAASRSARPLPSAAPSTNRLTRAGRAG